MSTAENTVPVRTSAPAQAFVDEGGITPEMVRAELPFIPADRAADMAYRLDGFFGKGLFDRALEKKQRRLGLRPVDERVQELRDSGISVAEAERIMFAEGYFGNLSPIFGPKIETTPTRRAVPPRRRRAAPRHGSPD